MALDAYYKAKDIPSKEDRNNKARNDFGGNGYSILDVLFPDFGGSIRTSKIDDITTTSGSGKDIDQHTSADNPDNEHT